jgi:NitT/TauT family transport system substrate-binding protein
MLLASGSAAAEGTIRIAEQFGIGYLPLQVIRRQKLIEKHGAAQGLAVTVAWAQLSGGSAMNDALLSGSIDVGSGGVGPLLLIWDRTKGNAEVRGIAAINNMPLFLNVNSSTLTSIKDFTAKDRIALPAVKISVQARTLQMAAEQAFGDGRFDALDAFTVSLPHPDAAAALLSGSAEITAHLTSPPYQYQELQNPKVHRILSSYDVLGGPSTFNSVWARKAFRDNNRKTYAAFLAALQEAVTFIGANRAEAASIYVAANGRGLDRAFIETMLGDPDIQFTLTPRNTFKYAELMARIGVLKNRPASWKDYYFDDVHDLPGS